VVLGAFFILASFSGLALWFSGWGDDDIRDYKERTNTTSAGYGLLAVFAGSISIVFTEMRIKVNHITFAGKHLTDGGQLIALLISIFALVASLFGAFKSAVEALTT
jgi:hypothetical protein